MLEYIFFHYPFIGERETLETLLVLLPSRENNADVIGWKFSNVH